MRNKNYRYVKYAINWNLVWVYQINYCSNIFNNYYFTIYTGTSNTRPILCVSAPSWRARLPGPHPHRFLSSISSCRFSPSESRHTFPSWPSWAWRYLRRLLCPSSAARLPSSGWRAWPQTCLQSPRSYIGHRTWERIHPILPQGWSARCELYGCHILPATWRTNGWAGCRRARIHSGQSVWIPWSHIALFLFLILMIYRFEWWSCRLALGNNLMIVGHYGVRLWLWYGFDNGPPDNRPRSLGKRRWSPPIAPLAQSLSRAALPSLVSSCCVS